ncbi:MAG: hypothetical protein HZB82_01970 [Deltaproteobacteria bacterium]|nr:hypothetical protein [Deltaproteobacteria bacterium]
MAKENSDSMSDEDISILIGAYPASRVKLFDRLLKKHPGMVSGRFWEIKPSELRFKHGETLAELKVPYHMGSDDEAVVENAILSLLTLIKKRYEPPEPSSRKETAKAESLISVGFLKDKTFRMDIFRGGSLEKKLAQDILVYTPSIDSAMLSAWLAPEGHGKKFIQWLRDLFEKILKEDVHHGLEERSSYLCLLAVINTIRKKNERTKEVRVKGLTYERLDLAVGLPLFFCLRNVLGDIFNSLLTSGAGMYNADTEALLMSAVTPKAFLAIPKNILSAGINPYGINQETFDAISRFTPDIAQDAQSITAAASAALKQIQNDPVALESLRQSNAISGFRRAALGYMSEFDVPGSKAQQMLFEAYGEDRLIRNLLNDRRMCGELSDAMEEVQNKYAKGTQKTGTAAVLQDFLISQSKKTGGFWGKAKKDTTAAAMSVVEGVYALKADDIAETSVARMRAFIVDRRAEFSQNLLVQEYNAGRLYRFSTDERPVINILKVATEGQLFVDMKDFTRKTLKVKEIAMAEFMKDYFYRPILNSAKRYGVGRGVMHNERGVWLTNLLGDAAIFTGGVGYLVRLATDIQKIIGGYRVELLKRLPPGKGEELLAEAHKLYETRKDELRQKRALLEKDLDIKKKADANRLLSLADEEHRLENSYRGDIEEAVRSELSAGLFISYGAKAEVVIVEAVAEFAGPMKVAIGEKINEAARGTGRNAMVRAKIEMLLENERVKRKNMLLHYPFDVYIDRIYSLRMPPELENALEKLTVTKTPAGAQALTRLMAEEYYNDLKKIVAGEPLSKLKLISASTDIYNRGQALSKEALDAYIKESKGERRFFKKEWAVKGLAMPIQEEFFFPFPILELWFGVAAVKDAVQVEAFCRIGEAVFKGFESNVPTIVYELLNPDGHFFKALMAHHFDNWFDEEKNKDLEGI